MDQIDKKILTATDSTQRRQSSTAGGGGGSPSPRQSERVPRDPQTQYVPPNDFNLPKRVYGADYNLSWEWARHAGPDAPCECPPAHNLMTRMWNGRKYWVCITECRDPNAVLGSEWQGPNPPLCECAEGFYYSQDNGCMPIPACPSGLVFDYSIEECIRECGPEQVWNRNTERCECIPDSSGRARMPNANTGECGLVPCNNTHSDACSWDNGNFQASLLSVLISSWLMFPRGTPNIPERQAVLDRSGRGEDLRFFNVLYGRHRSSATGKWDPPRVSISDRRITSRYPDGGSRVEFAVEPAFTKNEVEEIISMYRSICNYSPFEIKRGVWVVCNDKLEFQADPNGPCNCNIKFICPRQVERRADPTPTPSRDAPEQEQLGDGRDPPMEFEY